jgi:hypothetical protein
MDQMDRINQKAVVANQNAVVTSAKQKRSARFEEDKEDRQKEDSEDILNEEF